MSDKIKKPMMTFQVTHELRDGFKAACAKHGLGMSEAVRNFMQTMIDADKPEQEAPAADNAEEDDDF